ncbi:hypothetical protein NZK35_09195 [Stieleria sp. ICT_E10.1]|nr:hypothetical protein [Stieleria sedimenti]
MAGFSRGTRRRWFTRFCFLHPVMLMSRPVAMQSNLHNVLFVPADQVMYVANADTPPQNAPTFAWICANC